MPVDPHIDYLAHDPEDGEELSDDPKIREAQELEARMRRALATKENPLSDSESPRSVCVGWSARARRRPSPRSPPGTPRTPSPETAQRRSGGGMSSSGR